MSRLANTIVRRGGSTASRWYETIKDVYLKTGQELKITFSMSSKGGGKTDVELEIRKADFEDIIQAMCAVDRKATLEAMSIEMTRQLASPSALREAFERNGERRILRAARLQYQSKPNSENEREKMIYRAIEDIVYPAERVA